MYKDNIYKDYSLKTITTIQEFDEIRSTWESMQWHPNADIDFYLTIIDSRTEIIRPHILTLHKKNKAVAMLIGRIENLQLEFRLGYKVFLKPSIRSLTIIYGGILGEDNFDIMNVLTKELINYLNKGEIDVILFDHLKIGSDIYNLAMTMPNFMSRNFLPFPNTHWSMKMPINMDNFLSRFKSKHRSELRRTFRLLKKEYAESVEIKCLHHVDDVARISTDAEEIMKNTYQRAMNVGFVNNNEHQKRLILSSSRGWLRAYLMYVNKKPAALWIGFLYGDTFFLEFTGFDPQYSKYEPGTLLLLQMIEDLCGKNINYIDFGFGDALYKQRFGDTNWQEAVVYIFPSSIKGIAINLLRITNVMISRCAENLLKKTKMFGIIKRYWRKRLALHKNNL